LLIVKAETALLPYVCSHTFLRTYNLISGLVPEEEGRWVSLQDIKQEDLTPFARHVVIVLPINQWIEGNYIIEQIL
jgi:hypothetical protein